MTRKMAFVSMVLAAGVALAQEQRDDRKIAEANHWIYDDLETGLEQARTSGKPLMIVIRCPP